MNQIAKQGFYIRTYDRDIYLTKEQHHVVITSLNDTTKYIEIGDILIMVNQIKEILPASEYKKSAAGGYYCYKHPDNFVPKGKTCGYCA
jgi:hypothetical protein